MQIFPSGKGVRGLCSNCGWIAFIFFKLPWLLKPVITLYHLGKHTKGKARAVGRGKKVEADSQWCFKRGKRDTHGYFSPPKTSTHLKICHVGRSRLYKKLIFICSCSHHWDASLPWLPIHTLPWEHTAGIKQTLPVFSKQRAGPRCHTVRSHSSPCVWEKTDPEWQAWDCQWALIRQTHTQSFKLPCSI